MRHLRDPLQSLSLLWIKIMTFLQEDSFINFRLFCIQKFFFHTCIQRGSKKICHSSNFYNSYDLGKFQSIVSNSHKIQKRKAYKFVVFGHIQFQVGKLIINVKCTRFVLFISYATCILIVMIIYHILPYLWLHCRLVTRKYCPHMIQTINILCCSYIVLGCNYGCQNGNYKNKQICARLIEKGIFRYWKIESLWVN